MQLFAEFLDFLGFFGDFFFLLLEAFFHGVNAPLAQLLALFLAVLLVGLGDGIGQAGGLIFVFAINDDFNEFGVAHGAEVHAALQHNDGVGGFELDAAMIFLAPIIIELEFVNHLAQDPFRLDGLKFGLNEVGIVAGSGHALGDA